MNPYFLRLGLLVAFMMTSATSVEGVLRALKKTAVTSLAASSFLSLMYTTCDSFIFLIISQKKPRKKPTSSPTSSPTSPPPSSPTAVPGSPPSGGTPVTPTPSGGCKLNPANGGRKNCPIEAPYCMLGYNNNTICSTCTGLDSDCTDTHNANGTYCVRALTQSGYACAMCSLNVTGSCSGYQTCGTPSCIADMIEYCSEDHDADWCPFSDHHSYPDAETSAPTLIFNWSSTYVLGLERSV